MSYVTLVAECRREAERCMRNLAQGGGKDVELFRVDPTRAPR